MVKIKKNDFYGINFDLDFLISLLWGAYPFSLFSFILLRDALKKTGYLMTLITFPFTPSLLTLMMTFARSDYVLESLSPSLLREIVIYSWKNRCFKGTINQVTFYVISDGFLLNKTLLVLGKDSNLWTPFTVMSGQKHHLKAILKCWHPLQTPTHLSDMSLFLSTQ